MWIELLPLLGYCVFIYFIQGVLDLSYHVGYYTFCP